MSAPYKTTHLPPDEIDKLRLKAFATNEKTDVEAYYRAASLYFQYRHERAMNHADLCAPTDERVARLVNAVKAMPDDWCCDDDCDPCEELRAALRDMGVE